jgi:hypothetical protein
MKNNALTRREFLQLAGWSAAGLGLGLGAGRLAGIDWPKLAGRPDSLTLQAFLPDDPSLAGDLLAAFWALAGGPSRLMIDGGGDTESSLGWSKMLQDARGGRVTAPGVTSLRLARLGQPAAADLLLGDSRTAVYDPETQLPIRLVALRRKMHGQAGVWSFSAAYRSTDSVGQKAVANISGPGGLLEQVPLDRAYRDIAIDGPLGQTHLRLEDGQLWVASASCRHHLCQQAGPLSAPGQRAACAPNRLLVEVVWG